MDTNHSSLTDAQIVEFLLAEYGHLRELRGNQDTKGENRINFFLATVSGATVGIALLNQLSGISDVVFFINTAIFVGLLFIGFITFARMVERSISLVEYSRGMNRIRQYFVSRKPELEKYISLPINDDTPALAVTVYNFQKKRLSMTGLAPMVAIINSIIATIGTVLAIKTIFTVAIGWALLGGMLVFGILTFIQFTYQSNRVQAKRNSLEVRFPSL